MRRILSFDAGITHVGMVAAEVSVDWSAIRITHADCVDLTCVQHNRVKRQRCKLDHNNSLASRYAHFVQELGPLFNEADHYFVEQQPPQSAGLVFEQLLLLQCQGYTTSVHPAKIHKKFNLPRGDYDQRKVVSCAVALKLFPDLGVWMRGASREHDIADAACILKYECDRRHELWLRRQRRASMNLEAYGYAPQFCRACRRPEDQGQSAYQQFDCPRCSNRL